MLMSRYVSPDLASGLCFFVWLLIVCGGKDVDNMGFLFIFVRRVLS